VVGKARSSHLVWMWWRGIVEEEEEGFRSGAATLVELIDARGLRASAFMSSNPNKIRQDSCTF
jgi:hypothetical protein